MPIRWDNIKPDFSGANYLLSKAPGQIGAGINQIGEAFDDTTARRLKGNTNIVRQNLLSLNNLDTLDRDAAGIVAGRDASQYNVDEFQAALTKRRENLIFGDESKFTRDTREGDRASRLRGESAVSAKNEQDFKMRPDEFELEQKRFTQEKLNDLYNNNNTFANTVSTLGGENRAQGEYGDLALGRNLDLQLKRQQIKGNNFDLDYAERFKKQDLRQGDANYENTLLGNDSQAAKNAQYSLTAPYSANLADMQSRAATRDNVEAERVTEAAGIARNADTLAQAWSPSFGSTDDQGTPDTADDIIGFDRKGAVSAIRNLGLPSDVSSKMLQTMQDQAGYTGQMAADAIQDEWAQEMAIAKVKNKKAFTPQDPRRYSKVMGSKALANMMDEEGFSESTRRNIGNFLADLDLKGNFEYTPFKGAKKGTFLEPIPEDIFQALAEAIQDNGNEFAGTDFGMQEFYDVLKEKIGIRENQEDVDLTNAQKAAENTKLRAEKDALAKQLKAALAK